MLGNMVLEAFVVHYLCVKASRHHASVDTVGALEDWLRVRASPIELVPFVLSP